jgi:hypothetical protein
MFSFVPQSSPVYTTGRYDEEGEAKKEIKKREQASGAEFPRAVKKSDSSIDYDNPISLYPRLLVSERNSKPPFEVYNRMMKNCRFGKLTYKGRYTMNVILWGVCRDIVIMNGHCLPGGDFDLVVSGEKDFLQRGNRCLVKLKDVHKVGNDLYAFRTPGTQYADLLDLICDVPYFKTQFEMIAHDAKTFGSFHYKTLENKDPIIDVFERPFSKYQLTFGNFLNYHVEHREGLCGIPALGIINGKCFLAGIHTAGHPLHSHTGFLAMINKESMLEAIEKLGKGLLNIISEGCIRLPLGTKLDEVSRRSPLLYEDCPSLAIAGRIEPYRFVSPKSRMKISPFLPFIQSVIGVDPYLPNGNMKFGIPLMQHKRLSTGEYVSPLNNWIKKVGVMKKCLDTDVGSICSDLISSYLVTHIRKNGVNILNPTPLEIAVNGFPKNFYIRSMKMSTSAGLLFPGKKRNFSEPVELDFKKDSMQPNDDILIQVAEILNCYEREENAHELVGAQLKDEPRSDEKVRLGKTRVFAMSSYPSTIVNRMYLLPFYSLMPEMRDVFHTQVGINMHSSEGGQIRQSLRDFSYCIMEGDYGGYDTSMPVEIGLIANTIVHSCLKKLGYNEDALKIVRGILSDNLMPTMALDGNVFVAPGFQPSGKYATAEDNSLRGLILLYYAYLIMCTKIGDGNPHNACQIFDPSDFFVHLKPYIYGDDMLCAVKSHLAPFFNNITYSNFVREVYGMDFTTADKKEHTSEFADVESISFLKRTFKFNKMLKREVAVLDKDSMVKSLSYLLPVDVSEEEQIIQTCESVYRELFFYADSLEEVNKFRKKFLSSLSQITNQNQDFLGEIFLPPETLLKSYADS